MLDVETRLQNSEKGVPIGVFWLQIVETVDPRLINTILISIDCFYWIHSTDPTTTLPRFAWGLSYPKFRWSRAPLCYGSQRRPYNWHHTTTDIIFISYTFTIFVTHIHARASGEHRRGTCAEYPISYARACYCSVVAWIHPCDCKMGDLYGLKNIKRKKSRLNFILLPFRLTSHLHY